MAVLTSTGITFSDSTILNSKYGIIPQTTACVFYQASAPTGWTQVTTHNDKALRVVSGTGGGSGGTNSFLTTFPNAATVPISGTVPVTVTGLTVGATTLDINMIPAHAHPDITGAIGYFQPQASGPGGGFPAITPSGNTTGNAGNGGSHNHPISYTSASGPLSTSIDLRVQYIDTIICTFN